MILVDANLLVYAFADDYDQHPAAQDWLESELADSPRVGLAWPSLLAFARLVTNPRVFREPVSLTTARDQVERWLSADGAWVPNPGSGHHEVLGRCLSVGGLTANDVPDAHLAALAIEHGLTLVSCDGGFARFPEVRWSNPLAVS